MGAPADEGAVELRRCVLKCSNVQT